MKKEEYESKLELIKDESDACIVLTKRADSSCVMVEGSKDDIKELIYNLLDSSKTFESWFSDILAERAVKKMKEIDSGLGNALEKLRDEIKDKVLN
jgi:predicted MarR family transcription regulator